MAKMTEGEIETFGNEWIVDMGFGQKWPERPARPAVRVLGEAEKRDTLDVLERTIRKSPVLTAMGYRAVSKRGRFYIETDFADKGTFVAAARITPVKKDNALLMEEEYSQGCWSTISQGTARQVATAFLNDRDGKFHGVPKLDRSIREATRKGVKRLPLEQDKPLHFLYAETKTVCTVAEVLYHLLGMPVEITVQPRAWYYRQRKPVLKELDEAGHMALVAFTADSWSGGTFGGTCLYCQHDGIWQVFGIKPGQSASIATALAWLEKRGWKGWG
jgi:hypothetical protein